jgi:hypothetical protein
MKKVKLQSKVNNRGGHNPKGMKRYLNKNKPKGVMMAVFAKSYCAMGIRW